MGWEDTIEDDSGWESTIEDDVGESGISNLESFARGGGQGLTAGFQEEASAGLTKGMIKLNNLMKEHPTLAKVLKYNPMTGAAANLIEQETQIPEASYQEIRDQMRVDNQEAQEANPGMYMGGELTGALASTFIPGGAALNAGKGAKLATVLGKSALSGGLSGAGYSEADNVGDLALDTALGAGLGAGVGLVGKGLEKGVELTPKALKALARSRGAKALGLGKADFKRGSVDEMVDVALDEGVLSPLASTKTMRQRAKDLKSIAGKEQAKVYSEIDADGPSGFNPLSVATEMEETLNPRYRTSINKSEWGQLDNTIDSVLERGAQDIPLTEAQALKEEIGAVAYPQGKRPLNPTPKQEIAQEAYKVVRNRIDQSAENRASEIGLESLMENQSLPNRLKSANRKFGAGAKMYGALDDKAAAEDARSMLGMRDIFVGGAGMAALGPKGLGLIGLNKLADRFGNQLTATGANYLSKKTSQGLFPKLGGMFRRGASAATRTELMSPLSREFNNTAEELSQTDSPAATEYMLQSRDPQYRNEE